VAAVAFVAAGCGGSDDKSAAGGTTASASNCEKANLNLVNSGQLTVGTDNPAFPPWFGGSEKAPWKVSDPRSGEGFESAVAYAVAQKLGFAKNEVKWIVVPFNTSFAPGPKKFDFDINEISFTPARAKVVNFSNSYYNVNQAIVVKKGTKIANAKTIAELKPYKLGVQIGTTSYQYIQYNIKPSQQPAVYDTNDAAVAAADRRPRGRSSDGVLRDRCAGSEQQNPWAVPNRRIRRALRHGVPEGKLPDCLREHGAGQAEGRWDAAADPGQVAVEGRRRPGPEVAH